VSTKANVVANYLGQGWSAAIGFAFIPVYIRYLGIEAYGLIGLFAVLQELLGVLDLGMTPTLNREMARFTSGAHTAQSIRDLLRSVEVLTFALAAVIALAVWGASGYLAGDWLQAKSLPIQTVANTISVMAVVLALRFCETIYRSSLYGLQRQVWFNGILAILATVRHCGAAAILAWFSPTIQAFFLWQAGVSLLTVAIFGIAVHNTLPKASRRARFSTQALADIWKFAGSMLAITTLTILLTQVDTLLLSHLLPLQLLGYYMLALTIAGGIVMLIGPIVQAVYPRLVELSVQENSTALAAVYHRAAQLVCLLTAPIAAILSIFSGGVVFAWSGDTTLAAGTAAILSVLVVGTFLNGLMWMPYQCQIAYGWTSLILKTNIVAVFILVPAIFVTVPRYGAVGAAWIWVILNVAYVLVPIHLMHSRLMTTEERGWYVGDVLRPTSAAIAVVLVAKLFEPASYQSRVSWIVFLVIVGGGALMASTLFSDRVRPEVMTLMGRSLRWRYS
jgi:O-antigen/teichoic acid export membrane protein